MPGFEIFIRIFPIGLYIRQGKEITFILTEIVINITAFGKTDPGLKRSLNEDTFLVNPQIALCMVADGMGGQAAGDIASEIFHSVTTAEFSNLSLTSTGEIANRVKQCFNKAHLEIRDQVKRAPRLEGMGCTANLLVIKDQRFTIGHVGDSRTYRLRDDVLEQLTTDHSFVQQQIDLGLITEDQARTHKMRSVILQAVGVSDSPEIDIIEGVVQPDDMFMLCTDGLYTMLQKNQIQHILQSEMSVDQKVSLLVNLANGAGGKDNITVVLAVAVDT